MYHHDTIIGTERQEETVGKVRDILQIAKEKRTASVLAAEYMHAHISDEAYCRVLHCGDVLVMLEDELRQKRKLKDAWFCGKRMCPGCSYRGSLVNAVTISAISGALIQGDGRVALMVTVTAPNCTGDQLSDEILRYNRAWNDLMKHEPYKSSWRDHIRKFEVTYNRKADTYHPHIHALVFVKPKYFKHDYISRQRLLTDWRRVFRDQSITQVDIRKTHGQDWQAIAELSKYVAKSGDYLSSQQVFDVFYMSLRGKRLTGYAGRCKELRAEYRKGGLRQYVEPDLTEYVWEVIYTDYLRQGNYEQRSIKPFTSVTMDEDDLTGTDKIPVTELLPPEWDRLAD